MEMDFRSAAADATAKRLGATSGAALAGLGDSGCLPVGGRGFQFWLAVLFTSIPLIFFLGLIATIVFSIRGQISRESAMLVLFVLLVVNLFSRMPHASISKAHLSSRSDSFLQAFPLLPAKAVGLEEGKTYRKTKFVSEDSGVCLMDPERRRVLIEGCQYRYVFYAKDIRSVGPVSTFSLGGARLNCRIGEHELDLVLTVLVRGPLSSLIQAFAPSEGAKGLATELNRTFFGVETAAHRQGSLPPPIPERDPTPPVAPIG
jgi:hypothetical protein